MKILPLVLLCSALILGCSAPTAPHTSAPAAQPSARPAVEAVSAPIAQASATTKRLQNQLDETIMELRRRQQEATEFGKQIVLLRGHGLDLEGELELVWERLNAETQRNMFLEEKVVTAKTETDTLEASLTEAENKLQAAVIAASNKDIEASEAQKLLGVEQKANKALEERARKAELAAQNAKVYKSWVIIGAASLAGVWLLREILPFIVRKFFTGGVV